MIKPLRLIHERYLGEPLKILVLILDSVKKKDKFALIVLCRCLEYNNNKYV